MVVRVPRAAVAIGLLALAIAAWPIRDGPEVNGDGRLAAAYALVDRGSADLDPYVAQRPVLAKDLAIADGHHVLAKSALPTFVIAVPYALARLALPPARIDDPMWRWALTLAVSGVAFAACAALTSRIAARAGLPASPGAGLVAVMATPLLVYSAYLFSHVLAAALLAGLVLAATSRGRTSAALAGALAGAVLATETLMALAALPPVVYAAARARRDPVAIGLLIAGAIVAMAPQLGYSWVVFGSPLADPNELLADPVARQAYADPARGSAPPLALALLLLSPSYGLLLYAPVLVIGAAMLARRWVGRERSIEARLSLVSAAAPVAALVLLAPGLVDWHDRAQYGPRTVIAIAPLLVWPLLGLSPRALAIVGALAIAPHTLAHTAIEPLLAPSYGFAYGEIAQAVPRGAAAPSLLGAALAPWVGPWSNTDAAIFFAVTTLGLVPLLAGARPPPHRAPAR